MSIDASTVGPNGSGESQRKGAWRNLSWTYKIGLPVLFVSLAALAYKAYDFYYLPAYGDNPEELDYLKDADPRALLGGDMTHFKFGDVSFSEPAANLPWQLQLAFDEGDGHFERPFKASRPASAGEPMASNADGLGPIYNNVSCESCHFADGRTEPVVGGSLLVRVSVPGKGEHGGPKPHPAYGGQFGDLGIEGVLPEGAVSVEFEEIPGTYGDGEPYSLRKPKIELTNLNYGELGEDAMTSARGAPSLFGVGLLEAIDEETLKAWADPDDRDGDGISGRINMVWDPEKEIMAPGRFGWKAEAATVRAQVADAAVNDIGVTSPIHRYQSCTDIQVDCRDAVHGGTPEEPEFTELQLEQTAIYVQLLAVPARGHLDHPETNRGEELFASAGCVACHKPSVTTGDGHELRRLNGQKIQPFTDLLLHDMGEGLSDNRPSFDASGREWRTPPLWGIGMTETVNQHTLFLHDGRARGYAEAILWHGGEAEAAREAFRTMPKADREALVKFLKSL